MKEGKVPLLLITSEWRSQLGNVVQAAEQQYRGFGTDWSIVSSWLGTLGIGSPSTCYLKCSSGITASASPESSLEMASLRPHSGPSESESTF